MAEVTGNIGGQQVELNNAATEATLKQLLAAMMAMGKAQGPNSKFQKDYEKELKKLTEASKKAGLLAQKQNKEDQKSLDLSQKANQAKEKELQRLNDSIERYGKVNQRLQELSAGINEAVGTLTQFISSVASMGNSMAGAASVFSSIPVVGGMLSGVFGAVGGAADKLHQTFLQSASVGANFGGSIREMVNSASGAGLTIEQFSGLIAKSADDLRFLGGTTADGARRMADLGKMIRSSGFKPLNDDLARLGYSTEDINGGFAHYSAMLAKQGRLEGKSNAELVASTGDYLKNLDAVSRLTGKSKEALMAEEKARQSDAQFRMLQNKVGETGANRLNLLMNRMGPEMGKAFQAFASTGTAFNDQAKALAVSNPRATAAMERFHRQMQESGTVTAEMMNELDQELIASGKELKNSSTANALATYRTDKFGKSIVESMDYGNQNKTIQQAAAQQTKELADKQKQQKDSLDPAAMQGFMQSLAATSNTIQAQLAELWPKLSEALGLVTQVLNPLVSAFQTMVTHIEYVVGALVALKVAGMAAQAAMKLQQMRAARLGTQPSNAMWVRPTGGGDLGGKGGGIKNALKGGGALLKGAGVVGAIAGGAMLYSNLKDIDQQVASGEITAEEAKKQKGGAVGETGGALAGAAAGAAIGSVVPVVGTVIGGLVGGAVGMWLGRKGGEVIGEKIAEKQAMEKAGSAFPDPTKVMPGARTVSTKSSFSFSEAELAKKDQKTYQEYAQRKQQLLEEMTKGKKGLDRRIAIKEAEQKAREEFLDKAEKLGAAKKITPPKLSAQDEQKRRAQLLAAASGGVPLTEKEQLAKALPATTTTKSTAMPSSATVQADLTKPATAATAAKTATPKTAEETIPKSETPGNDIASLNTTMAELTALTRLNSRIMERQLRALSRMSGDMYTG